MLSSNWPRPTRVVLHPPRSESRGRPTRSVRAGRLPRPPRTVMFPHQFEGPRRPHRSASTKKHCSRRSVQQRSPTRQLRTCPTPRRVHAGHWRHRKRTPQTQTAGAVTPSPPRTVMFPHRFEGSRRPHRSASTKKHCSRRPTHATPNRRTSRTHRPPPRALSMPRPLRTPTTKTPPARAATPTSLRTPTRRHRTARAAPPKSRPSPKAHDQPAVHATPSRQRTQTSRHRQPQRPATRLWRADLVAVHQSAPTFGGPEQ